MRKRVVGTVASLLFVLLTVVHVPLQAHHGLRHEPGVAVALASGAVLPPASLHKAGQSLPPPTLRHAGPARVVWLRPRPPVTVVVTRAVHDPSEPRAPPSGDL
ncbi:hypothetical protein ACFQ08_28105 [Streptosporangium algeriense]|uniref:Secreted protein n=1 Tax=Streptosporangium algeriense TaxID=1682748 RepID=A0ABW3DX40_9ACTN